METRADLTGLLLSGILRKTLSGNARRKPISVSPVHYGGKVRMGLGIRVLEFCFDTVGILRMERLGSEPWQIAHPRI